MDVENTLMKNYSGTTLMSDKQTMRTVTHQPRHVPDAYAPAVFNRIYPDPESWLAHMRRYASYRQMDEADQLAAFPLFLKDSAIDWFDTLDQETKHNMEQLLTEFQNFFCPSPLDHVLNAESVFTRVQRPTERLRDYVTAVQKLTRSSPALYQGILKCIILRGLNPNIKAFVLQQRADTKVTSWRPQESRKRSE